jgi:predicted TIM-barrel fold metal-dependent hydrolase
VPVVADHPGHRAGAGPVLDSHTHAWRLWPYAPLVPDEGSRGTIDQLLYEMDTNGVEQALVVCAAIGPNPDNVEYVASARERHPSRLHVVADLDCTWSKTYHLPGSADRLKALAERYTLAGFTHYVAEHNDGWLLSDEAEKLFGVAAERALLVSLAAGPPWQADLRVVARKYPSVPVLCHHLGEVRSGDGPGPTGLEEVVASASVPNVFVKVSGFHYSSQRGWDHPWPDAVAIFRRIFDAYGPERLCWGSDFPASTRFCTFRQSLEVLRQHCPFLAPEDLRLVLGGTLRGLLATGHAGG